MFPSFSLFLRLLPIWSLSSISFHAILNWTGQQMSSPSTPSVSEVSPANLRDSAVPRTHVLIAFAAVYVLWGSTYFFIRIGVETIPPFVLAGIRHIALGLGFYPLFRYISKEKPNLVHCPTPITPSPLFFPHPNHPLPCSQTPVP